VKGTADAGRAADVEQESAMSGDRIQLRNACIFQMV